jgi:hypothetical protein
VSREERRSEGGGQECAKVETTDGSAEERKVGSVD